MSSTVKQVIVLRKDLNMRKGKMVAQGAHASLGAYEAADSDQRSKWRTSGCTKICVGVDSHEELAAVLERALELKLPCYLVTDAGRTEFKGVPTRTSVAVGPARSDLVDLVTGELKLL